MSKNSYYQQNVLTKKQTFKYWILVLLWIISVGRLIIWWFSSGSYFINQMGFVLNSLVMGWVFIFPGWFYYYAGKMKTAKVSDESSPYPEGRIGLVVTKAPSEPWEMVKQTLIGMLNQDHPQEYDVWLADENPDKETLTWCEQNSVNVSTRYGVEQYHNTAFPRRTKSKEGNLAFFYDKFGYDNYDFMCQFDADHIPESDYLTNIMLAFKDPTVGYVACPSICDSNVNDSWLVRARLWVEAGMHGALQAGYSSVGMPFAIGSHYAVRVAALKGLKHPINTRKGILGLLFQKFIIHIGGLGAELAEDHVTSLAMVANGWKGAFSLNAIAHGDGADSFAASMQQEFQWSRSLTQVLLSWTRGYFGLGFMGFYKKFHFLLGQLWYIFFSVTMLIGNLIPIVAVMSDKPIIKVDFLEFSLVTIPVTITALLPLLYLKKLQVLRPSNYDLVSVESLVFAYVRWPWAMWGVINGVIGSALGVQLAFKVTKKGSQEVKALPFTTLVPYFVLIVLNAITSLAFVPQKAAGYLYFTQLNAVVYSLAVFVIVLWHVKDNWRLGRITAVKSAILPFIGLVSTTILVVLTVLVKFPEALKVIMGLY